jgi:hypothetical protein
VRSVILSAAKNPVEAAPPVILSEAKNPVAASPHVILSEAKNPAVKGTKRHPARSRRQPTEN